MSIEVFVSTYVSPFKDLYKSVVRAHRMYTVITFESRFSFYSLCLYRILYSLSHHRYSVALFVAIQLSWFYSVWLVHFNLYNTILTGFQIGGSNVNGISDSEFACTSMKMTE